MNRVIKFIYFLNCSKQTFNTNCKDIYFSDSGSTFKYRKHPEIWATREELREICKMKYK